MPPEETLKHSKAGLAQYFVGSLGPGAPKVLFEPSKHLWQVWGLILNAIVPSPRSCGFFVLGYGTSFLVGSSFLLLIAVQKLVAILVLSQKKMSILPSTLPS